MYLIRDLMYCKPGKVKPMVEKYIAMAKLSEKIGLPKMKIMTDMCAERYWTIVSEVEVETLQDFENMMSDKTIDPASMKEFEKLMEGYHELVDHGKREIYKLEG